MANQSMTPWRRGSLAGGGGLGLGAGGSLFDLHRQVNRLFDDMFDQRSAGEAASSGWGGGTSWPQLEVEQHDKNIQITAELPGVKQDDIDLTIEDGILTLRGEKRSERKDENGYSERSYGRFERRISLPPDVDDNACRADFRDGVLTVTLPRSEQKARGRKIPLGGGGSSQHTIEAQNDRGHTIHQQAAQEPRSDQQGSTGAQQG